MVDEQDREADIIRHLKERVGAIDLGNDVQPNPVNVPRELKDSFDRMSRRRKGSVLTKLDRDQLSRRDFLKLLGVGVGTAAAIGTVPALIKQIGTRTSPTGRATASCDYETIQLSSGEKRTYDLSDNEVFENTLIDQTADGAEFTIRSRNKTGWTIRNVGFHGTGFDGGGSNSFQLQVSTPGGGHGLIENVYMYGKSDGPGTSPSAGTKLGGGYLRGSHAGHIDVKHTYIEGFGNNAFYGSSVGKDGHAEGSVVFQNCFHRDNTVSQFRFGSPGSGVYNCVGIVHDPEGLRGPYPGNGERNARCVWGKHFRDQLVRDSAFVMHPDDTNHDCAFEARYIGGGRSNGPEAVLNIEHCALNEDAPCTKESTSNATVNITDLGNEPIFGVICEGGVPTSAEEAACGQRGVPDAPELGDVN